MREQILHSTALKSGGPHRYLRTVPSYGFIFGLFLAIALKPSLAQQPYPYWVSAPDRPAIASPYPNQVAPVPYYQPVRGPVTQGTASPYPGQEISYTETPADYRDGNQPVAQFGVRPINYQTEILGPIPVMAGDSNPLRPLSQPWIAGPTDRLAQNTVGPEIIRPGTPTLQIGQPPASAAAGAAPSAETAGATQAIPSPYDPTQFRLPTLGPSPRLTIPEPTPEIKRQYGQFVAREIAPENTIQVIVGRAKVMVLREKPRRIYAPDENVASIQVVTDLEIAIVGKKAGTTVLNLWFPDPTDPNNPQKDRTLSYTVVVQSDPDRAALELLSERRRFEAQVKGFEQAIKVLQREIKEAFPDGAVQLSLVGEQVVVRGEAKDAVEAAQILRIVAAHSPTGRRTTLNQSRNVNVNFIPGLGDEQAAVDAIRQLLEGNPNLVNLLRVPGEQQVMLMVTVAEVNRTAARTIGMDFSITKGGLSFAQNTGQALNIGTATAGSVTGATGISAAAQALRDVGGNLPTAVDNGNVLMAIQALRTLNFARSLAEPNLTTLNGKPARFLAGGSFPIPNSIVLPGGAAQSVTYQDFGVSLQFTPFITDRDRIRLQLNASVSTPSVATTQVSGAAVPSEITQRQFSTTVELREGQTLTVAGLIQNNFSGQSNRVPFWGDLPIIGRTGGVDSLSSGEQELVVLVTPVLVHPLDMCQTPPLPGNDIFEPGDIEFYLLGHLEGRRSQDYRASVRTDYDRQKRFIHCDDMYIIGPHGTTYGCCKCGNCPCPPPMASSAPVQPIPEPVPAPQNAGTATH